MTGLEAVAALNPGLATTTSILRGARELTEELKKVFSDELVPAELLRVVYLDVEYNLRLLDIVPGSSQKKAAPGTDPVYFNYGKHLRWESLVAMLLQFSQKRTELPTGLVLTRDQKKVERSLDRQEVVSLTREVVLSIQVFQTIADIPPGARRPTMVRRRLYNVRTRLQMLQKVLRNEDTLKALSEPARPLHPKAPAGVQR